MAKRAKKTYVGPIYTNGLRLYGYDHDIRPADFSADEIEAFVEKHPDCADWWADAPAPPPEPERRPRKEESDLA